MTKEVAKKYQDELQAEDDTSYDYLAGLESFIN